MKQAIRLWAGVLPLVILGAACAVGWDEHGIYEPLARGDWEVSTPQAEGLDPDLVLSMYQHAKNLSNLYSLLIVKNGKLVAEKYFQGMDYRSANPTASVTKSITSSLAGIAIREHILAGLDQTMAEFFPEIDWPSVDPRKLQITIRQMLQMRSGFPWEEFSGYVNLLSTTPNWIPLIAEIPLAADPGAQFGYSNLTSHLMGIILARAAKTDLRSFAQTYLFDPLGAEIRDWFLDTSGYYYGHTGLSLTPRDMAKYGLLYLNGGEFRGVRILPSEWVAESLLPASFDVYGLVITDPPYGKILTHFDVLDYGYLWWSSKAGSHAVKFALGHGGQMIVIVPDLDMIVVTSADTLPGQSEEKVWGLERAIMEMVGEFIEAIG